jgi:cytochrome c5
MCTVRRRLPLAAILLAALAAVAAAQTPAVREGESPDIVEHFKYGSIGTEGRVGVPYWIWRVLPIVFEDKLPNRPGEGYERLGFLFEGAPHGRPIGTTHKKDRVDVVGLNCATCHVGSFRTAPGEPRQVVAGMPAAQMDLQGYARFLSACANDPRFNAATLIDAIGKENPEFGFFKRLFYRLFVVGRTRRGILDREKENAWFDSRPPQGPGRVDTFNPYKVILGFDIANDRTVGTVDLPSLGTQRPRRGLWLHWDGNNTAVEERNKSAAIGAGATPDTLDLASMRRIEEWVLDLQPPAYPMPIDAALAEQGGRVYQAECASCHEFSGARIGQVTELAEIGTDPERVNSFSAELARAMNTIGEGKPWRFSHFRKTNGYSNMPLDGLWLRAPYLHNGSVPTLRALLSPDERPAEFYRAYDVYDWKNVGFVSSGPGAEREGVRFTTTDRGNSNAGHLYGAALDAAAKNALLEYLKTK